MPKSSIKPPSKKPRKKAPKEELGKLIDKAMSGDLTSTQVAAKALRNLSGRDDVDLGKTLYSLTTSEIHDVLLEKVRTLDDLKKSEKYSELLTSSSTAKGGTIAYIAAERSRLRTLWEAARFLEFHFEELTTKDNWRWMLKVVVHQKIKKVHADYDVRMVLSPLKHWDELGRIEGEIKDIEGAAQQSLIDDEKNARLEERKKRLEEREIAFGMRAQTCPPVVFEGEIKKVEYKDVWIEEDGEKMQIPGTVLTIHIPGNTVDDLNAIRSALSDYHIRLQPIA